MNTFHAKPNQIDRRWFVIDATDQILGRMSTQLAMILRGKHKAEYTPHVDVGDFVIVINAEKVRVTGGKSRGKEYFSHTGWPEGGRWTSYEVMKKAKPERIIELAVKGMIPRTRLGRKQLGKLFVYAGPNHPHEAQQPVALETKSTRN